MSQITPAQENYLTITKQLVAEIASVLTPEQQYKFMSVAKERFRAQPELANCKSISVINALKEIAISNVEPTTNHAVFIIRKTYPDKKNKKVFEQECNLQWTAEGKKRAINVATDGECYVLADVIRRKDKYQVGGFPRKLINHEYDFNDRGDIIGAYAVLMRSSTDQQAMLVEMSIDEIEHIRDTYSESMKSKNWNNNTNSYDVREKNEVEKGETVWYKEFSEMCIKTIVGRLHKRIKANINSYTRPKNEFRIDTSTSQTNNANNFDFIDVPNIANTSDEAPEIDVNLEENTGFFPETKPETVNA